MDQGRTRQRPQGGMSIGAAAPFTETRESRSRSLGGSISVLTGRRPEGNVACPRLDSRSHIGIARKQSVAEGRLWPTPGIHQRQLTGSLIV